MTVARPPRPSHADGASGRGDILVVYALEEPRPRATIRDHLYSFARHSGARCHYVNVARRRLPRYLARLDLRAVIFHTSLLSQRWQPPVFRACVERVRPLARASVPKVGLPQDEFIHTDALRDFIDGFALDVVFSPAPASELPRIYGDLVRRVRFLPTLTGFIEPSLLSAVEAMAARRPRRRLDVGYRACALPPSLGRHARLKAEVGEVVRTRAGRHGLRADISCRPEDTIVGDAWFDFLLDCRYTLGVEGGASILDPDGSYLRRTQEYLARQPAASPEEIEAACFPGAEGSLALYAISPRHLEACLTRTCQVLIEGAYDGVLRPGEHYIPLRRDLSDVDEVLGRLGDEAARLAMVERAYRDVVASGRYGYDRFVADVLRSVDEEPARPAGGDALPAALLGVSRGMDRATWLQLRLEQRVTRARATLRLGTRLRRALGRGA